jgi:hypothetical protein
MKNNVFNLDCQKYYINFVSMKLIIVHIKENPIRFIISVLSLLVAIAAVWADVDVILTDRPKLSMIVLNIVGMLCFLGFILLVNVFIWLDSIKSEK